MWQSCAPTAIGPPASSRVTAARCTNGGHTSRSTSPAPAASRKPVASRSASADRPFIFQLPAIS